MEVKEAIMQRHSVRSYKSDVPSRETLSEVLEAGRMAPSAVNLQPWRFVCLLGDEREKAFCAYQRDWVRTAPAVIVVIVRHGVSWHRGNDGKDHADVDAAIATDHMTLRAAELGLGTCWVCNFDAKLVAERLGLASDEEAVVLLPIGYSAEESVKPRQRKPAEEVWSILG